MINTTLFYTGYEAIKGKVVENHKAAAAVVVAAAALFHIARAYQRALPFDRWDVTLGLWSRDGLTQDEIKDLSGTSKKYSPLELVRRAFQSKGQLTLSQDPIRSTFRDDLPLSLEEEKAVKVQSWTMRLIPFFSLFSERSMPWYNLLRPIQESPRLAYTIGFNCLAPFATQAMWESVQDFLPSSIREVGSVYLEHKGKIALASFAALLYLFYCMRQERGVLTNLTENFLKFRKAHRELDQIPSYQEVLNKLQQTIETSVPGQPNSNILWYYSKNTHKTFVGEIGNILGEMTASGRLKNVEIIEFNIRMFLTEYRHKDEVYRGWYEALGHLTRGRNVLVVFTEIEDIKPYLIQLKQQGNQNNEDGARRETSRGLNDSSAKVLSNLIRLALEQGKIRCLLEVNQVEKQQMESIAALNRYFSAMKSPNLTTEELKDLAIRLYGVKEEMDDLFRHTAPAMERDSFAPADILDTISGELRKRASHRRQKETEFAEIEKKYHQILEIKEALLQRSWSCPGESEVQEALKVVEMLVPLYAPKVSKEKDENSFVEVMQKGFARLFGPASPQEKERLNALEGKLGHAIKGQEEAVKSICEAVTRWRTVPPLNGKPLVLFFAGTPGVGKSRAATELAYQLSFVYGIKKTESKSCEENVLRVNLNRKTAGGFIGWDKVKAEVLAHLLKRPTSVIIFEEWDKMDGNERSNLLELLDDTPNYLIRPWSYSSENGPFIDKSCATFVLTSNILGQDVQGGIKKHYGDEVAAQAFLSRIDALVPFKTIEQPGAQELIQAYLDEYIASGVLPGDKRGQVEQALKDIKSQDARDLQREVQQAVFKAVGEKEHEAL